MFSVPDINSKDISRIILYIIPNEDEYIPQMEIEFGESSIQNLNLLKAMDESLGWARYKFQKIIEKLENE